jgi:hypothetical protein
VWPDSLKREKFDVLMGFNFFGDVGE